MTWWHYLLLVNIYLTLFFGFYALLLRRETFFQLNRVYLVGAAVLSFFIPLIQARWVQDLFITQQVQSTIYQTSGADIIVAFEPIKDNPVTVGEIMTLLYAAGAALLAIRLIWQLFQVKQLMSKPSKEAYSFFKTIKAGEETHGQDVIIRHEEVHAEQWHSADVLIIEAVMIINWFNPVVYLYRFAIKHVHEFIADRQALEAGTSKADYALLLLSQTFDAPAHQLVNPFYNHSLLKQRIMMLQKDKSQRIKLAKYGLSAPLFILMLILSSATINNSKAVTAIDTHAERVFEKSAVSVIPDELPQVITKNMELEVVPQDITDESQPGLQMLDLKRAPYTKADTVPDAVYTAVQRSPTFPGGDKGFGTYLSKSIKYPAEARDKNVQGRVIATFVVEKDGSLTGVKIVRGIGSGADEEALRVLKISPKWIPGMQNGKPVRVQYSVPISFALAIETDKENKSELFTEVERVPAFPGGWEAFEKYLGRTLRYPAQARKNKTEGRVIVTFVVEKDGSLTNVRVARGIGDGADEEAVRVISASPKWVAGDQNGHKVRVQYSVPIQFKLAGNAGKTGKMQVDDKKFNNYTVTYTPGVQNLLDSVNPKKTVIIRSPKGALSPLYIVDGKEVADLEQINPNNIQSINVMKDASATEKYGMKGINGVIIVELKPAKPANK
jgi:TonB family protein